MFESGFPQDRRIRVAGNEAGYIPPLGTAERTKFADRPALADGTRVVFGFGIEGRAFPEHAGPARGAVDQIVVGPPGLLGILTLRLGLSYRPIPASVRVATWLAKLVAAEQSTRFWSASLLAEPWSTAEATLAMRDALVEGGWAASSDVPCPRVADIAAAQSSGPNLPKGPADLLREVIQAVENGSSTGIERLDILDHARDLPPGWRDLASALAASGVELELLPVRVRGRAGSDLLRLQRRIRCRATGNLTADGTFSVLRASTALAGAEVVAEWLAAGDRFMRGTVVVAPDEVVSLIDLFLGERAMPALGGSVRSPHRGAMQVLPTLVATLWRPLDIDALLRLIQLPCSPLPPRLARRLANALAREPGIEGDAWAEAWIATDDAPPTEGKGAVSNRLAEWLRCAHVGRFARDPGIPKAEALAAFRLVHEWARWAAADGADPIFEAAANAAQAASMAVAIQAQPCVPAALLENIVRAATADFALSTRAAEASAARVVRSSGAVWGKARKVIWWERPRSSSADTSPWTPREREALQAAGVDVADPVAAIRREAAQRLRAVSNIRDSLVVVEAALDADVEGEASRVASAIPLLPGAGIVFDAEAMLAKRSTMLAGRRLSRLQVVASSLPSVEDRWPLPKPFAKRISERVESATALEDMAACPLRWLLTHVAGLRPGGDRQPPSTERLLGDLVHAVAKAAFRMGEIPEPRGVEASARRVLPRLIAAVAAPLLRPEMSAHLAFATARIPRSLGFLATLLARNGVRVLAVEEERARQFAGFGVAGRVDMVVLGTKGSLAVIDLKWTASPRIRRDEIADGRAVQLATYRQLVHPEGRAHAGYYLVRQESLVGGSGLTLATDRVMPVRSLGELWQAIETERGRLLSAASNGGHVEATPQATRPSPCRFCDMRVICRIGREERNADR